MKNFDNYSINDIANVAKRTDLMSERFICIDAIIKRYRRIIKSLSKYTKIAMMRI